MSRIDPYAVAEPPRRSGHVDAEVDQTVVLASRAAPVASNSWFGAPSPEWASTGWADVSDWAGKSLADHSGTEPRALSGLEQVRVMEPAFV